MKLIFSECLIKNKIYKPTIILEIGNNENHNLKLQKNLFFKDTDSTKYIIDIENDIFDILNDETLNKLNLMFEFAYQHFNTPSIQKIMWNTILLTSKINLPFIKKSISNITNVLNVNYDDFDSKKHSDIVKAYSGKDDFEQEQIIKNQDKEATIIEKSFNNDGNFDFMVDKNQIKKYPETRKEMIIDNELDLLYGFLDMLFDLKVNYSVLRCKNCKRFFIASKTDTIYCKRKSIQDNELVCSKYAEKERKKYSNIPEIQKEKRRLMSRLNSSKDPDSETKIRKLKSLVKELKERNATPQEYIDLYKNFEPKKRKNKQE